jgi:hypothetical protein
MKLRGKLIPHFISLIQGSQKVPGILWQRRFGVPRARTAWTECYLIFLRALCSSEEAALQVAGRESGFCIMITHRATQRLLCHLPATALSGSHWLLPTLKMGLKGTHFVTMKDRNSNATAKIRKIPKEAFRRCLWQWQNRWRQFVCVLCSRALLWRSLGKRCCMSCHYSAISPFRELFDCPSYVSHDLLLKGLAACLQNSFMRFVWYSSWNAVSLNNIN